MKMVRRQKGGMDEWVVFGKISLTKLMIQ